MTICLRNFTEWKKPQLDALRKFTERKNGQLDGLRNFTEQKNLAILCFRNFTEPKNRKKMLSVSSQNKINNIHPCVSHMANRIQLLCNLELERNIEPRMGLNRIRYGLQPVEM